MQAIYLHRKHHCNYKGSLKFPYKWTRYLFVHWPKHTNQKLNSEKKKKLPVEFLLQNSNKSEVFIKKARSLFYAVYFFVQLTNNVQYRYQKKCLYSSSFLIPLSWGKPPTTSGFSFGFLDQHKNIFIFLYFLWLLHHHNDEATDVSSSPVSSSDLQGSLDGSKSTKSFASNKVVCNCFQKRCF